MGARSEHEARGVCMHDVRRRWGWGSVSWRSWARLIRSPATPRTRFRAQGGPDVLAAAAVYQIPNTEHMAYRLVRTLVYKRGVGIRETVWVIKCGRWS